MTPTDTPTSNPPATPSALIAVLREDTWGANVADTLTRWDRARYAAADMIEALTARAEAAEADRKALIEARDMLGRKWMRAEAALTQSRVDGWNAGIEAARAWHIKMAAEDKAEAKAYRKENDDDGTAEACLSDALCHIYSAEEIRALALPPAAAQPPVARPPEPSES